tara:strand:+ start:234 stop:1013 length:780 start_codon:yes stop_codon:yes gene_type:complete
MKWIDINSWTIDTQDIPALLDRYNLLPSLIRSLVESTFTSDIKPDKEEQLEFYNQFLKTQSLNNKEDLDKWLKSKALDEQRISIMLFDKLKVQKLKNKMFDGKVDQIFLKDKEFLDRVTYSLLRVKTQQEAEEFYLQLSDDEASFAELSSKFSKGMEKNLNGLIGPIPLGETNPEIAERLKVSKPGQLWPPFSCQGWWLIIRLEKNLPAVLDDKMRENIKNMMYEEWINSQIFPLINQLRNTNKKSEVTDELSLDKDYS